MAASDPTTPRRHLVWRDLSVGTKLFSGFASVGLLLFASLGTQYLAMSRLAASTDRIVAIAENELTSAEGLQSSAADLRGSQAVYLIDRGAGRAAYEASQRRFGDELAVVRSAASGPTQDRLAAKIGAGYETFMAIDQLIWESVQSGDVDRAAQLALGPEGLNYANLSDDADSLAGLALADTRESARQFASVYRTGRHLALGAGIAAIVLVVALSVLLTRAIRRPLTRVQHAAERAAAGDLTAEADVNSLDETGRLSRAFDRMLDNLRLREDARLIESQRQELDSRLHRALDMADHEPAALGVVSRALDTVVADRETELLLTNGDNEELVQAAVASHGDPPGCPVASMGECTAVRHGRSVHYPTSQALDACPKLLGRAAGPLSATCIPVTFMGGALGVLHTTGAVDTTMPESQVIDLETLAARAGARIGMLRSIQVTQEQATTDPLTGLMNRRAFEVTARDLYRRGVEFTLIMGDLDHFKLLNDSSGHEAGDDALRVFAEVLRSTSRSEDYIARWGGEEFVILLPGCTGEEGLSAAQRIRATLADRLTSLGSRPYTCSFGIAQSTGHANVHDVINAADVVLYEAKEAGRDTAILAPAIPAARTSHAQERVIDAAVVARARDDSREPLAATPPSQQS